ncbi:MAG: WecB/TagA/CpsF family glycosyltransferase [Anaerolineae bacterium]|nr:WecB/TagA/CpsF family glycosyltransferase [Anaerolineae bacterium]
MTVAVRPPEPVFILGFPIHPVTYASFLDLVAAFIAEGLPRQVCTANPEFIMTARRRPDFAEVLRKADLVLPDGVGLLWAARRQGTPLPERVTGSDGIYHLAARAATAGWRLFLLGAEPGVAAAAAERLQARYPGLIVAGTYPGSPSDADYPAIADRIRATRPDILLVAYGAPAQDLWIARHKDELGVPVSIGVGGAFDHVTGRRRRAPAWMIRLNLEWLWRLLTQPWRWRRQLDLPRFVWTVWREGRVTGNW